ncbi:MAG: hypothetical protein HYV04_13395 [Deltaproteobacteria bacterium]|nr:hypothetical protein [Deltaproteobacteria bacterium]
MKKLLVIFACLVLIFLAFLPQIRLGVLTALFIRDVLDEVPVPAPHRGALSWVTATPSVSSVSIGHGARTIAADLYFLPTGKKRGAILLTHGIIEAGKDDPRLIRFAYSLARTGFAVLVPELRGMKSLKVLMSDVEDIVASFQYLAALHDLVDEKKVGLLGFSYAAGPTLMGAANPEIQERVKFVVSFGGYYDPINVIRFITTGYYEYGEERGVLQPEPYGKWVFFINNLEYVESPSDRSLLEKIFALEQEGKKEKIEPYLGQLSPQGASLYELLINQDPQRVEALVEKIDPRVRGYLEKLSMAPVIPSIQAYLIIGHGSTDPLIPYTESLRLADAAPDRRKVHVAILRLFSHVDPARQRFSAREYLTTYLPSMVDFYFLIYDLLSQQQ